jgi:hypothetical protein
MAKWDIDNRVEGGCSIGMIGGGVAGAVATVWGGYEIGEAINNAIGLDGYVGRQVVDLITIATVATPVIIAGVGVGFGLGVAGGFLYHHTIENTKKAGKSLIKLIHKEEIK